MSFVSPTFAVFFVVALALYLVLRHRWQNLLLLVTGAIFYGWEHPEWVLLLYLSAGIDYFAAIGMERYPEHRRPLLAVSVTANLSLLGWFKYANFGSSNLRALGFDTPELDVVLPAGISFYTFQSMSYTIDVYRGQLRACRSFTDYFAFISFFPQLVAGPIERAHDLLTQIQSPRTVTLEAIGNGLVTAAWGVALKAVIADNVALYVDRLFGLPRMSLPMLAAGASAFSVQILADFSGYTTIALGVATCFGFKLSRNFLHPFLAANPTEHWTRWHVTFSGWIRDYLYVPLGGSRGSKLRVAGVTLLTMGLSGLWHGASWNFVLWGLYHGFLVVLYRPLWPWLSRLPRWVTVPIFYVLLNLSWFLFRQHDLGRLAYTLQHPAATREEWVVAAVVAGVGLAGGAVLVAAMLVELYVVPRLGRWKPAFGAGLVSLVVCLLLYWSRAGADGFIYFRF